MPRTTSLPRRILLTGAAALAAPPLAAQGRYPDRPISILCPVAPGGILDLHLRFLAERASRSLGQPIVVEPRTGAAGTLAAAAMAQARPDGHALAVMTVSNLRYPHIQQTAWDPLRDFTFIAGLGTFTFGVVVRADARWPDMAALIAEARGAPERLTYGTTGVGGTGHLLGIDIERATGARFTHVPFRGGPEYIQALLARQVDFSPDGGAWPQQVDAGTLRLLALATEEPMARFPGVPTLRQAGIDAVGWSPYGLVGPRGLPEPIVAALFQAFRAAMDTPEHAALLDRFAQPPWQRDPAAFRAWAEQYFVSVRPSLEAAGLLRG